MAKSKVLLINPIRIRPVVGPLGLEYISASLKSRGCDVELIDASFTHPLPSQGQGADGGQAGNIKEAIASFFAAYSADVVGVSIRNIDDAYFVSQEFFLPRVREVIDCVKACTSAPIVLGGCGFSVAPEAILDYLEVDLGIRGDGEHSFCLLVDCLSKDEDYTHIPGLVTRCGTKFITNSPLSLDLDKLPLDQRGGIDNLAYFTKGGQGNVETKRGCPKHCIYCVDPVAKGREYRLRSPEKVADEIEVLLDKGINYLHFCDSEFNLPLRHAEELCQTLIRRGLGEKIRWYAYASPVPFDRSLAALMRKAGCRGIDFGVDSGCDEMLKNLSRDFSVNDVIKTASICHEYDLVFMYDLLFGGPGESRETIRETIDLMKEISPSRVGVSTGVRVYPNTPLAKIIARKGIGERNRELYGKVEGNENLLQPIFYVSSEAGEDIAEFVASVIGDDSRFFFANPKEDKKDYNYNENVVLVDAIRRGYRGAYWDILRRLKEEG